MIHDEFEIKINEIIKYLKENGGYNYKLYNRTCCMFNDKPDSNIVEYAEDIKNFYLEKCSFESYEKFVIYEICKIIKDNLELLMLNDESLLKMKKYCKSKINNTVIHSTSYDLLIDITKEALLDLLLTEYLYDYRDLV